jgi:hypothetical protein
MLILIADENFNNDIVRGMLRRKPDLYSIKVKSMTEHTHSQPRKWIVLIK